MNGEYLNAFLQAVIVFGFAAVTLLLSVICGKSGTAVGVKNSPYECGMLGEGDPHARFSVKFYIVAMLFVIFDIEVVYLYPWAVVFKEAVVAHGTGFFWGAFGFLAILLVGYLYALKKGALRWSD